MQRRIRALAAHTLPRGVKDSIRRNVRSVRRRREQRAGDRVRREQQRRSTEQLRAIYEAQHSPIDSTKVFYESFGGRGALCNPEAIFRHAISAPQYSGLTHVWALDKLEGHPGIVAEFASDPRVSFVEVGTTDYFRELSTSRYLINNTSFPPAFRKRDGQVYLNTWHGTPLKAMGYDVAGGREDTRNVVRNFLHADYLLSPNQHVTDGMFRTAFRLDDIYRGKIIEDGYPRIERGLGWAHRRGELVSELGRYGFDVERERVVVYAPTWRGSSPFQAKADIANLREVVSGLLESVDTETTQVALKVHQFVYDAVRRTDLRKYLVPNDVPTNLVLAATDVLVTDYSSIFVDFLPFDRSIVFYVPDPDGYAAERGSSFAEDDLPGGIARSVDDLTDLVSKGLISHDLADVRAAVRKAWASRFCAWDELGATARVAATFFGGEPHPRLTEATRTGKQRVVIYLGGMLNNGITTSVLNLLSKIDYERFDVTALYTTSKAGGSATRIDPRVRVLPRVGRMIQGGEAERQRSLFENGGISGKGVDSAVVRELFAEEWRRCFGDAQFDHAIDFSGYSSFWAALMLAAPAHQRTIWLHNDLERDSRRTINGQRPHEKNLKALFSLYRWFDTLVSVSPTLAEINREKLGEFAPDASFVAIENLLDGDLVADAAFGPESQPTGDAVAEGRRIPRRPGAPGALVEAMDNLERTFGTAAAVAESRRRMLVRRWVGDDPETVVFVTVGRLSPEKNQRRAIDAFSRIHAENPKTRLIVVGGGPLEASLKARARALRLGGSVVFTGHQDNPYAIMTASDCFVFSSRYEGQGLAILEARRLGLPIVTSRFNVVEDVVPPEAGLITDASAGALADGLRAFLRGEVPSEPFDVDRYNAGVLESLNALLSGDRTQNALAA